MEKDQGQNCPLQSIQNSADKEQKSKELVKSEHALRYQEFFEKLPSIPINLQNPNIHYSADQFENELKIRILKHDNSYKIVMLQINYGYFEFTISVINSNDKSQCHSPHLRYTQTKQSTIYFLSHAGKKFIVKCITITKNHKADKVFGEVIKEYALTKLASELGAGVPVSNYFGFQIFFYEDCVQFFVQECSNIVDKLRLFDQREILNLKKKLKVMHSLKMVHLDIKPQNILYSKTAKEFTFIDFGYSRFIQEDVGFKTKTNFLGTPSYCSPEMSALFGQKISYIDLYYNDIFSLQTTIKELKRQKLKLASTLHKQQDGKQQSPLEAMYEEMKEDQAYKNMISRILSIRLQYQFFKNNTLFMAEKAMRQFILSNSTAILQIIANISHYNSAVESVFRFIFNNSLANNSIVNIQIKKQQQMILLRKPKEVSQKVFLDKLSIEGQDKQVQLISSNFKVLLILSQDKWRGLFQPRILQKYPKHRYYSMYCEYINFKRANAQYEFKQKASQVFLKHENVPSNVFVVRSEYTSIEICLKYILEKFLQQQYPKSQQMIPLIMDNLYIMDALSDEQILGLYQKVLSIDFNHKEAAKLLFKLNWGVQWIQIMRQSRSSNFQFIQCKLRFIWKSIQQKFINYLQQIHFQQQPQNTKRLYLIYNLMFVISDQTTKQKIISQLQTMLEIDSQLEKELQILKLLNLGLENNLKTEEVLNGSYELHKIDDTILSNKNQLEAYHILFARRVDLNTLLGNILPIKLRNCFNAPNMLSKIFFCFTFLIRYEVTLDAEELLNIIYQLESKIQNLRDKALVLEILAESICKLIDNPEIKNRLVVLYKLKQHCTKEFLLRMNESYTEKNSHIISHYSFFNMKYKFVCIIDYLQIPVDEQLRSVIQTTQQQLKKLFHEIQPLHKNNFYFLLFQISLTVSLLLARQQQLIRLCCQQILFMRKQNIVTITSCLALFKHMVKLAHHTLVNKYKSQILRNQIAYLLWNLIINYKLYLVELYKTTNEQVTYYISLIAFEIQQTYQIYFNIQDEILLFLEEHPHKFIIQSYAKRTNSILQDNSQNYFSLKIPKAIQFLFANKQTKLLKNKGAGLILSVLLKYYRPMRSFYGKLKYYICKNVDFVASLMKTHTLINFFSQYFFTPNIAWNPRQRRYLIIKYANYISRPFEFKAFIKKLGASKVVKKSQQGGQIRFYERILSKLGLFHERGFE